MTKLLRSMCVLAALALATPAFAVNIPMADVTVTSTATLIVAYESGRLRLSCTNNSADVAVRWANSAVTAAAGQRFPADRTIEIQGPSAVYMISEDTDVSISCTKEMR